MNSFEQIDENMNIADKAYADSFTPQETVVMDKVKNIFKDRIKVNCTACGYCLPCPKGVDIPSCFSNYNNFHMFGDPNGYKRMKNEEKASNCIECGKCENHCPQSIKIRLELKNLSEVFAK